MPNRQAPSDYDYRGFALDFRRFDRQALDDIVAKTGFDRVIDDGPDLEALLARMNNAAIWLDHDMQNAAAPTAKQDDETLRSMLSHVQRLRGMFQLRAVMNHGLAPGPEGSVPFGIRRLLEDDLNARLSSDTPIPGWSWPILKTPPHARPLPAERDENLVARSQDADEGDVEFVDVEGEDQFAPLDGDREPTGESVTPDFDPEHPEAFFGAREGKHVLRIFANQLALLEASASAALEVRSVSRAERATPEREFVLALIPIYAALFGRTVGSSVNAPNRKPHAGDDPLAGDQARPGGPLIRFLNACMDHVVSCGAQPPKDETLRKYIRDYKNLSATE